jgi:hypothetical protein
VDGCRHSCGGERSVGWLVSPNCGKCHDRKINRIKDRELIYAMEVGDAHEDVDKEEEEQMGQL